MCVPQILGLTASPDGMEKDERRRKGKGLSLGLQHNMNAHLITVPSDGPLRCQGGFRGQQLPGLVAAHMCALQDALLRPSS